MRSRSASVTLLLTGAVAGAIAVKPLWDASHAKNVFAQATDASPAPDLMSLQAEVTRLKGIVPDQAHAMQDVDYHFTNLWFAAQHGNWPLAQFYFNETKSHLHWAVRIIPVRKDNAGREVKLEDILQAVENSPLKQLDESIQSQDHGKFVAAYEFTLTSCHTCHKAADKPYLRPRIPEHPATTIINFDPNATWPK